MNDETQLLELREEVKTLRALLEVQESIALHQAQKAERLGEEQSRADAERLKLKDEIIRMQEELLSELSAPLILLSEGVVLMPLIGRVDEKRARHMLNTLLSGIQAWRARVAILDVTGMPDIDARAASILMDSAAAARLLGTKTALTGIRPEVALRLIELSFDYRGLRAFGDLRAALAWVGELHLSS